MAQHVSSEVVRNPMDYNRAQIRGLVTLMTDIGDAISIAPENFNVSDLNYLVDNAYALIATVANLSAAHASMVDWSLITS